MSEILSTNKSFIDFKLARPLIRAINELGYIHPTRIQSNSIPEILSISVSVNPTLSISKVYSIPYE